MRQRNKIKYCEDILHAEENSELFCHNINVENIKEALLNIPDINQLQYCFTTNEKEGRTFLKYFKFRLHGFKYIIRMSNKVDKPVNNVRSCRFHRNSFILDAFLYGYDSTVIINIITNIDIALKNYNSSQYKEEFENFIVQEINNKDFWFYENETDEDDVQDLTDIYFKHKGFSEDKDQIKYLVIKKIFGDIYKEIIYRDKGD